jgi:hypothetical protein
MRSTLIALCLCAAAVATPAQGHDSEAPPAAPHSWLPEVPWVMQHWVPFDEARLHSALGVDNLTLERWLRNDHHTIAELARARTGVGVPELTENLIEPWKGRVDLAQLKVLREHTRLMLTQGHLAQHVLYHYFHGTTALEHTRAIFGVSRRTFQHLRARRFTPLQIGHIGGRTPKQVTEAMRRLLATAAAAGVTRHLQTPEQAAYMQRRRAVVLACFLHRPLPKYDAGSPSGDHWSSHRPHARGERPGLAPGSRQLTARGRPDSCWHEPALRKSRTRASVHVTALCRTGARAVPARHRQPAAARPGTRRS